MKRIVLILSLLTSALVSYGQNNPYELDDECYVWYLASVEATDDFESDTFDQAQQNLLELSLRHKDTKAQTIYYVQQLKHTSHLAQNIRRQNIRDRVEWDAQYWNSLVDEQRETLMDVAKATGYMQYYYYAFDLCQTYYFNTDQDVVAVEMLMSMMKEARLSGDEYGMWKSLIFLSLLYKRINDQHNTQFYLREAVKMYENTSDETILRQSMTDPYCNLACTYAVGSDSARLYFDKAARHRVTRQDSLKVAYFQAQLAAWDGDIAEYHRLRDYCYSFDTFETLILAGNHLFDCIDNILKGSRTSSFRNDLDSLYFHEQLDYAASLAYKHGQWETAATILFAYTARLHADIFSINRQSLGQMSAEYENNHLLAELAAASHKAKRTAIWVAVLLSLLLLSVLTYTLLHVKNLKKAHEQDEASIARLQKENDELKE